MENFNPTFTQCKQIDALNPGYMRETLEAMGKHGTDILELIENHLGEIPAPPKGSAWSTLCTFYYSYAVELWAGQFDLDGVEWD